MKTIYIFLLGVFLGFGSYGQQTPEFEFQLYFEDVLGNRDTITIGYDPAATDGIDADFGEENILNQAWSESLDARIGNMTYEQGDWITSNSFLSKIQILDTFCSTFMRRSETISIQFNVNNLPIIISAEGLPLNFWDAPEINCMGMTTFYGYFPPMSPDAYFGWPLFNFYEEDIVIELNQYQETVANGMRLKTYQVDNQNIAVLQFFFQGLDPLSIDVLRDDNFRVFPNPFNDILIIENQFLGVDNFVKIYDLNGRVILEEKVYEHKQTIDVSNLKGGVYIVEVIDLSRKLVKKHSYVKLPR